MGGPNAPKQNPALVTTQALIDGEEALRDGNATTALAHFDEALLHSPENPEAYYRKAIALAQRRRDGEALEQAKRCLFIAPGHVGAKALVDELSRENSPQEQLPPWSVGELVDGRWEVFGSAEGGMGRVYFVRDRSFGGMELAVKTLRLRWGATRSEAERARSLFRREAQVWLDLGAHPNVVSGFYTLEVQAATRFFMEYVPGLPLDELLRRQGPTLPLERALDLAIQLAYGVEFVHARVVAHRDLKSANCLVMDDGTLRLTDFGLGRSSAHGDTSADGVVSSTRSSSRNDGSRASTGSNGGIGGAGTPQYMAPEQWRSLSAAGTEADVYAFGVLLYELFAGRYPFEADEQALQRYHGRMSERLWRVLQAGEPRRELVLLLCHLEVEPIALRELRSDVPTAVEQLALQCMQKRMDARPTIARVREELLRAYQALTGERYPRELPGAFGPNRAGENNRAVSYFVMGDAARAKEILDGWLQKQPTALYPWINRASLGLRSGERSAPATALAFAQQVAPAHPAEVRADGRVRAFVEALEPFAPVQRQPVHGAAFSPDGMQLALASGDDVLLWSEGEAPRVLRGHSNRVTCLAFSPDGALLVSGCFDKTARVWGVASGRCVAELRGHRDTINAVGFSPDGRWVLTGASVRRDDRSARLWDAFTGRAISGLGKHGPQVEALAFSPDGRRAVTGNSSGSVALWELADEMLLYLFEPGVCVDARICTVAFTPEGASLWIVRADGVIERWSTDSGARLWSCEGSPRGVSCATVRSDGRVLAVGYEDGTVRLWSDERTAPLREWKAHEAPITAVALSSDGRWLCACSADGALRFPLLEDTADTRWPLLLEPPLSARGLLAHLREREELEARLEGGDAVALVQLRSLLEKAPEYQRDVALVERMHRAGRQWAVPIALRDAWVVDAAEVTSSVQWIAGVDGRTAMLAAGPALWRWEAGRAPMLANSERASEATEGATALAYRADGGQVLAGFESGVVRFLRADTGRVLRAMDALGCAVTVVAFSPDGSLVLLGGEDGTARVMRAEGPRAGTEVARLRGHRRPLAAAAFSEDGRYVVTGAWDRTARVWELRQKEALSVLSGHRSGVTSVVFSPDGRRILTAGDDRVLLWYVGQETPYAELEGHTAGLTAAVFSPGARYVATAGWDASVRLWRSADGTPAWVLSGHPGGVTAVAFGSDGGTVLSAGADGALRRWQLDAEWALIEQLLPEAERVCATGESSRYWPHVSASASADAWLDLWHDVRFASARTGIDASLLPRVEALRTQLRLRLRALNDRREV